MTPTNQGHKKIPSNGLIKPIEPLEFFFKFVKRTQIYKTEVRFSMIIWLGGVQMMVQSPSNIERDSQPCKKKKKFNTLKAKIINEF